MQLSINAVVLSPSVAYGGFFSVWGFAPREAIRPKRLRTGVGYLWTGQQVPPQGGLEERCKLPCGFRTELRLKIILQLLVPRFLSYDFKSFYLVYDPSFPAYKRLDSVMFYLPLHTQVIMTRFYRRPFPL